MNLTSAILRPLRRFGRARRGVAAVEFAVLAPMMLIVLFGTVDVLDMLHANRRVQNTAAALADVTARDTEISNEELSGIWAAMDVLLYPSTSTDAQARLTSVRILPDGTAEVVWSEGRGMSPRSAGANVSSDIPDQMRQPGASLIWSEMDFPYQSPLGFLTSGEMRFKHSAFRRSRLVDPIPRIA